MRLPRRLYSLGQKIIEHTRAGRCIGHVLLFHDVYADAPRAFAADISLSKQRFVALLDRLPVKQVGRVERLETGRIFLTFDDICESAFWHAFPLLRERNLPFAVFITPALLDRQGYITRTQLKELACDPLCSIGAHGFHHRAMRFLSSAQVEDELRESKKYLEELCLREVTCFAYPYGSVYACSKSNVEQVKRAGFACAFSTLRDCIRQRDLESPWFLPRININDAALKKEGIDCE